MQICVSVRINAMQEFHEEQTLRSRSVLVVLFSVCLLFVLKIITKQLDES